MEQSFIAYIKNSIQQNWDLDALTDYKGTTLQYKDVARKIEKLHILFEESGIRKGDKIALVGFGTFSVQKRAARDGHNPRTGKKIKIEAKSVVKFKAGATLTNNLK